MTGRYRSAEARKESGHLRNKGKAILLGVVMRKSTRPIMECLRFDIVPQVLGSLFKGFKQRHGMVRLRISRHKNEKNGEKRGKMEAPKNEILLDGAWLGWWQWGWEEGT